MSPVPPASQVATTRYVLDDDLGRSTGLHVAVLIRKAHDGVCVGYVYIVRILAGWIERDAEGLPKTRGECGELLLFSVRVNSAKDENLIGAALGVCFRNKHIAIRCGPNHSG